MSSKKRKTSYSVKNQKKLKYDVERPIALVNNGLNCYLNSTLQAVISCSNFVKELIDLRKDCPSLKNLNLFCDLISKLQNPSRNTENIENNEIFLKWNKSGQQDSFELLAFIINKVYNEIRKSNKLSLKEWHEKQLPMKIILKYIIKCDCGNVISVPIQSDLALHVPLLLDDNKNCDLSILIDNYFNKSKIEQFECDKDNCDSTSHRAFRLTFLKRPLPNTICIHLQRTFWDGFQMIKINKNVNFDKVLHIKNTFCINGDLSENLSQHMINHCHLNDRSTIDIRENDNNEISKNPMNNRKIQIKKPKRKKKTIVSILPKHKESLPKQTELLKNCKHYNIDDKISSTNNDGDYYYLKSVIVHYGSICDGHYICYRLINNVWFLTNDCQIREVDEATVFNSVAYILFYEKK